MLAASERYYATHGEPLFSSHMIDLSEEPMDENIEICVKYLERMSKMDMLLEMEVRAAAPLPSCAKARAGRLLADHLARAARRRLHSILNHG